MRHDVGQHTVTSERELVLCVPTGNDAKAVMAGQLGASRTVPHTQTGSTTLARETCHGRERRVFRVSTRVVYLNSHTKFCPCPPDTNQVTCREGP